MRSIAVHEPRIQSPIDPVVRCGVLGHLKLGIALLRGLAFLLAGVALVYVGQMHGLGALCVGLALGCGLPALGLLIRALLEGLGEGLLHHHGRFSRSFGEIGCDVCYFPDCLRRHGYIYRG